MMNGSAWCPAAAGLMVLSFVAAPVRADEPQTLDVWPAKAPGDAGDIGPEQTAKPEPGKKYVKRVTNVSHPTLTIFRPEKDKDTGAAVVVCPGGGYKALMMDYEGEDVAKWLNTLGVTGIVLKYRVPAPTGTPRWMPALQDAQRAMSLVRSKAKEWNLDPARIGLLGFSAGGHLTAAVSAGGNRVYEPVDEIDKVSFRPDFAVAIYPGGLLNKEKDADPALPLNAEGRPTAKSPPTFIVQATDDRGDAENSVYLYLGLRRAGVPVEMHLYAGGGHGFGLRKSDKPCATWPDRCAEWLGTLNALKPAAK